MVFDTPKQPLPDIQFSIPRIKAAIASKKGWRFESTRLPNMELNPEALKLGGSTYPTLVSPKGVKIALDSNEIFLNKNRVWLGDPAATRPDYVTLAVVCTPEEKRKKGYASKALRTFMSVCDTLGITVRTEPVQIKPLKGKGSMTTKQLVNWYKRLGWERSYPDSDQILERKGAV